MIEETGVVKSADGIAARVIVQKRGACEGCAATGTCESTEDGMEIEALNPLGAKPGQVVKVYLKPQTYLKGTLVIYGVPLVAFIAGVVAGKTVGQTYFQDSNSDLLSAFSGLSAFVLGFLGVRAWSRRLETKAEYKPVIEEVIEG